MSRETVGDEVRSGDLTVEGTVKTPAVNHPDATDGGLAISSTGAVSGGLPVPNRNLLYNGAMQVAQRGTSATGLTNAGYRTADRWNIGVYGLGAWTNTVENNGPQANGFTKSLKITCTTADASPASGDILFVVQSLEGQDVQRIAKGTASARQLTISFWAKSNVTGTYVVELTDADNSRAVSAAYTITTADLWEYKTVTFPADTTGTLDNDNAASLGVIFWLGAGSTYTSGTLQTAWASLASANRAPGQTNLAAAVNNYWQVTGVQLETGPVATEFEHRSFGDELARCQRYFIRLVEPPLRGVFGSSTTFNRCGTALPTTMRTSPTLTASGTFSVFDGATVGATASVTAVYTTPDSIEIDGALTGSVTAFRPAIFYRNNTGAYVDVSAEL